MSLRAQKIRVGLFALTTAAIATVVIAVFGGMRLWRGGDAYHVTFRDTVYGLEEGANVYQSGVRVGSVEAIEVAPEDPAQIRVRLVVRRGTPVRVDTRAMLQYTGITGLKVIDLRGGTPGAGLLPPGSAIPAGETAIDKLQRRAEALADQSVQLMERANRIVENVAAITDPAQFEGLGDVVRSARAGAANLEAASASLRAIAEENRVALRRSVDAVGDTARSASALLDGRVTQLAAETGELLAQLRGLVRDNEGTVRAAMFDLRQASRSFKELAREVRQRPSRLFFSGAPADRRLP